MLSDRADGAAAATEGPVIPAPSARAEPGAQTAGSNGAVALDYQQADEALAEQIFSTDHLKSDLKGRTIRGGTVTVASQSLKLFMQTVSTMVLARLLVPADFGLVGMVTAITGFFGIFTDLGLSTATIQRSEITQQQVSALFWVNVLVSLVLTALTAALAPAIAWFYGEPRVLAITLVTAVAFIIGGLTAQHQALLQRQMRFLSLAIIDVIAFVWGFGVAVVMARHGAHYWALVGFSVTSALVQLIAVWSTTKWRPSFSYRGAGVREMLAFGGHLTGFNMLNYLGRNLDNVLIGRVWGSVALGLYARAYNLMMLPLNQINAPISAVALPCLSCLHAEPQRYRQAYLKFVSLIATFALPGVTFCLVMAREIVLLVMGKQWVDAITIFQVLAIAALIQPVTRTNGLLFISTGRTKAMLRVGTLALLGTMASFLVGLPWGAIGVSWSYAIFSWLVAAPILSQACKTTPVDLAGIARCLVRPAIVSILVAVALVSLKHALPASGLIVSLAVTSMAAATVWFAGNMLLTRQVNPMRWMRGPI